MYDEQSSLKTIYAKILAGFSQTSLNGEVLYFKHLTPLDHSKIDIESSHFYEKAVDSGVLTREEKIQVLKDNDSWPKESEEKIYQLQDILSRQKTNIKKLRIPSQIEALQREIKKNSAQINDLKAEIDNLIGYTAESYSFTKLNEIYTYHCCYRDESLTTPMYSREEFESLEDTEISKIISLYNTEISKLNTENIRKIAISDFFSSTFSICKDSPMIFYGKPACSLSNFQSELFVFGIIFKNIFNKYDDIPDDVMKDPDKLMEWHEMKEGTQNNQSNMGIDTSKSFSMIGANKDDYKKMGHESGINLSKIAREKGKPLSMRDIIELEHGKGALK